MSSPESVKPTTAIITGSARGIGRAIALQLAKDGYDIALNDVPMRLEALKKVAEEVRIIGRKAVILPGDVTKEVEVDGMVEKAVGELGDLYIMVANAGVGQGIAPVAETTLDTWNRILSVNLTGVFLCYRAATRQLLKQGRGGRIIGASSVYGKRGAPNASAYTATKFGVRGLTQSLADELGKTGITVNAYAPGFIDTDLISESIDMSLKSMEQNERAHKEKALRTSMASTSLNGKMGTVENVAALVSYIASDKADFMTGQTVSINGGYFFD